MQSQSERALLYSRLCEMEQDIAASTDTDQLLGRITACAREITDSESASILLLDEEHGDLYFKETLGELGETIKKVRVPLDTASIAGIAFNNRRPTISNKATEDPRHFKGVDRVTAIPTRSVLAVPIIWGERIFGVLESINKLDGGFTEADQEVLTVLANHAAVVLYNVGLIEQLQNFFVHTIEILIAALESIEPGSQGHVIRVSRTTSRLARELGILGKDYETLYYAAYFHDIGKLMLETSVVARNDKRHPVIGSDLLERIKVLEKTAPLVRHHHERWDGSGFPDHLVGEQTPQAARILALAEDYDESWMDRPPEQELPEFLLDFLSRSCGRHDPELLELLGRVISQDARFEIKATT
ncbi:MAG: HD domain-containing phosphohydrolase [Candidatus Xenobium sp.]|jgi:putative nucleotidyltransferase with HDIG domain|nr:GAF domain-containing protein [Burkholderiales bacterium]